MASKCNLFKQIGQQGTFLLFSQYAEDLTRQYTQNDNYRVVPARFAALDIDTAAVAQALQKTSLDAGSLPEIFQDYYENMVTLARNSGDATYGPTNMSNMWANLWLWKTLEHFNMVTISDMDNSYVVNGVVYSGDINITSYEEVDGTGYNELFCYIANEAHKTSFLGVPVSPKTAADSYISGTNTEYVSGYDGQSYPSNNGLSGTPLYDRSNDDVEYDIYKYSGDNPIISPYLLAGADFQPSPSFYSTTDDTSFQANAIIVFYDVVKKNVDTGAFVYVHHNIPMGIYFTGWENGNFANTINKVVKNDDIFGQGTSYGLRLCMRYLCTHNSTEVTQVSYTNLNEVESDGYTRLLAEMAESQDKMQQIADGQKLFDQNMKNHLSIFTGWKANVPYVRNINGVDYWFVNGKNTGVSIRSDYSNNGKIIGLINSSTNNEVTLNRSGIGEVAYNYAWAKYTDGGLDPSSGYSPINPEVNINNTLLVRNQELTVMGSRQNTTITGNGLTTGQILFSPNNDGRVVNLITYIDDKLSKIQATSVNLAYIFDYTGVSFEVPTGHDTDYGQYIAASLGNEDIFDLIGDNKCGFFVYDPDNYSAVPAIIVYKGDPNAPGVLVLQHIIPLFDVINKEGYDEELYLGSIGTLVGDNSQDPPGRYFELLPMKGYINENINVEYAPDNDFAAINTSSGTDAYILSLNDMFKRSAPAEFFDFSDAVEKDKSLYNTHFSKVYDTSEWAAVAPAAGYIYYDPLVMIFKRANQGNLYTENQIGMWQ